MRLGKTTSEEEWFLLFFAQLGDGPIDNFRVQKVGVIVFHRPPRRPGLRWQFVRPDWIQSAAVGLEVKIP